MANHEQPCFVARICSRDFPGTGVILSGILITLLVLFPVAVSVADSPGGDENVIYPLSGQISSADEKPQLADANALGTFNIDFEGQMSGAWKETGPADDTTFGDFASAWLVVHHHHNEPDPSPKIPNWNHSENFFTDDTGYINLTDIHVGDSIYIRYYMGNDICSSMVDVGGGTFERVSFQSSKIGVNGDTLIDVDFDWTDSEVLDSNPEYYVDMNGVYHLKKMHNWYEGWLGDTLKFTQVALKTRQSLMVAGNFNPGSNEISINGSQNYVPYTLYHEMAHAVLWHSVMRDILYQGGAPGTFWNEAQADYFASSFLDQTPAFMKTFYDPNKCWVYYTGDPHELGGIQTAAWWDIRDSLGQDYTDSLVFFSSYYNTSSQAEAVRSLLMADDNNSDLSDSTPNANLICNEYANQWVGPYAILLFAIDGQKVCVDADSSRDVGNILLDTTVTFSLLTPYPWDSLVWDFDDGSATVKDTLPTISYSACGTYDVECKAYYPWGVNVDTQVVEVEGICGDADSDGVVDTLDVDFLLAYVFSHGPAPTCDRAADVNGDCSVNVGDIVYLNNYLRHGGDDPVCGCSTLTKASPEPVASLESEYDGERTTLILETPVDIHGLQIEISCEPEARIDNLAPGMQMHLSRSGERATIGLLDLDGSGHIAADRVAVFTISGQAEVIDVVGADRRGSAVGISIGALTKGPALPEDYSLSQNYPNPFNPVTTINYALKDATHVTITVFNTLGQEVRTLADEHQEAGWKSVIWDGTDDMGVSVSSGIYFYRIDAADFTETRKMMLLK